MTTSSLSKSKNFENSIKNWIQRMSVPHSLQENFEKNSHQDKSRCSVSSNKGHLHYSHVAMTERNCQRKPGRGGWVVVRNLSEKLRNLVENFLQIEMENSHRIYWGDYISCIIASGWERAWKSAIPRNGNKYKSLKKWFDVETGIEIVLKGKFYTKTS